MKVQVRLCHNSFFSNNSPPLACLMEMFGEVRESLWLQILPQYKQAMLYACNDIVRSSVQWREHLFLEVGAPIELLWKTMYALASLFFLCIHYWSNQVLCYCWFAEMHCGYFKEVSWNQKPSLRIKLDWLYPSDITREIVVLRICRMTCCTRRSCQHWMPWKEYWPGMGRVFHFPERQNDFVAL